MGGGLGNGYSMIWVYPANANINEIARSGRGYRDACPGRAGLQGIVWISASKGRRSWHAIYQQISPPVTREPLIMI